MNVAPQTSALSQQELDDFTSKLVTALKTVYDPEIPVDIYELGLIYKVDVSDKKDVTVDMTLTAHGCPAHVQISEQVRARLEQLPGVRTANVGPLDVAVADGDSGCIIQRGASETTVSGNRWERCRTGLLGWDVGAVRYHGNAIVDPADPDHAVTIGP